MTVLGITQYWLSRYQHLATRGPGDRADLQTLLQLPGR